jgi:serine/threonine protein kinase
MGEVYLAEDSRIDRQVAIKVVRTETELYPDPVMAQDAARLFRREMRAIAMLDHPHILPLHDFGEEQDGNMTLTYMVMPLRQEGSLVDWLQKRGSRQQLLPNEVSHFVMQVADALQHAHEHHLIHQDVKPSNFLVRSRLGNLLHDLLLMDFGIAKITTATAKENAWKAHHFNRYTTHHLTQFAN